MIFHIFTFNWKFFLSTNQNFVKVNELVSLVTTFLTVGSVVRLLTVVSVLSADIWSLNGRGIVMFSSLSLQFSFGWLGRLKSADNTRKQLQCLSNKIGIRLKPVYSSRKIGSILNVREPKPDIVSQQCLVYYFQRWSMWYGLCWLYTLTEFNNWERTHERKRFCKIWSHYWDQILQTRYLKGAEINLNIWFTRCSYLNTPKNVKCSLPLWARFFEPWHVSLGFASVKHCNFTPDFSNPRFFETLDISN